MSVSPRGVVDGVYCAGFEGFGERPWDGAKDRLPDARRPVFSIDGKLARRLHGTREKVTYRLFEGDADNDYCSVVRFQKLRLARWFPESVVVFDAWQTWLKPWVAMAKVDPYHDPSVVMIREFLVTGQGAPPTMELFDGRYGAILATPSVASQLLNIYDDAFDCMAKKDRRSFSALGKPMQDRVQQRLRQVAG